MPPSAFEREVNSITRWLGDTFPDARIHRAVVPAGFRRPAFLVEVPRASPEPVLPSASQRQTAVPVTYFGNLDVVGQNQPWNPVTVAGMLEEMLRQSAGRIPLRDETGTQVGTLRVELEWSQRSGTDTDLTITIRYRRLIWNRQADLEGEPLDMINLRPE